MSISIDDVGVVRRLADGRVEQVRWDHLAEVWVRTTSDGPWGDDFFWILVGDDGSGCVVVDDDGAVLRRVQSLPGFDNTAVIEACASVGDASFLAWRRASSGSAV